MVSYWRWLVNDHESNVGWIVEVSDNGGLTWTDIESTNTQDIQWRRNVIRVEDHIEVNNQFRIQFIAADPIFEGSGALVEAAVDDIFVWDAVESSVSVSELDNPYGVQLFPNPMHEQLTITSEKGQIQRVELISMTGQIIMSATPIGEQVELDVEGLSAGMYSARIVFDDEIVTRMVIK